MTAVLLFGALFGEYFHLRKQGWYFEFKVLAFTVPLAMTAGLWCLHSLPPKLYTSLAADTGLRSSLEWAEKHAAIIRRFGRFPHRNAILGRATTPEEQAYLDEGGFKG